MPFGLRVSNNNLTQHMVNIGCGPFRNLRGINCGNFDGTQYLIHTGLVGDYWTIPFVMIAFVQKTVLNQLQDHAMMMRAKSSLSGDRVTMTIRTGGKINFRLRKGDGTGGREIESDFVPDVGEYITLVMHWDTNTFSQIIGINGTNYTKSSTSNVVLGADADPSGIITIGNSVSGVYPYIGRAYGGGFKYGLFDLSYAENISTTSVIPYGEFIYNPSAYGSKGTILVREPNNRNLTLTPDVPEYTENWWG